jgi:restriction system protein
MARRTTVMEDLFDIASKIPWWLGVGVALAIFLALHIVASQTIAPLTNSARAGEFMAKTLYVTLASYGQWILPIPLLVGAGVSAYRRNKRAALHAEVAESSERAGVIEGLSWQEFEQLVGEAFRRRGFTVSETGGGGADGGIDLVLTKGSERHLVQCKQWKALKVGVTVVRELYGVMAAHGATGGFVVCSGKYSPDAMAFARGRNIELIDGQRLAEMICNAKAPSRSVEMGPRETGDTANRTPAGLVPTTSETPACPRCGSPMVKRVAKQGANAGNPFWGCSKFPDCRGIRNLA